MREMPTERLYSIAGAAKRLNKHPNTIANWLRAGKLPRRRMRGRKWKLGDHRVGIPESAIEAILACPCCTPRIDTTSENTTSNCESGLT